MNESLSMRLESNCWNLNHDRVFTNLYIFNWFQNVSVPIWIEKSFYKMENWSVKIWRIIYRIVSIWWSDTYRLDEKGLCAFGGGNLFPPAWNVGPLLSLSFSLFFLYNFFLLLRGEAEVVLTPKWCSLDHATRLICPSFVCVNSDPKWPTRVFCVLSDLPGNLLNSQNENTRKYDR